MAAPVKIYVMTDMEGISGISNEDQTDSQSPEYSVGQRLLCPEVNAAIAGAFEGGANEVLVSDGHGTGFNLLMEEMDARAQYERPNGRLDYMPGLDESFAGVFCVGYHAMAGTLDGFLDHTMNSTNWLNYSINGRCYGELGIIGLWAGSCNVPVLFVSGDQAACNEAHDFFEAVETVAVKQGIGRQYARCDHPVVAREKIREGTRRAMSLVGKAKPNQLELPSTVRLEYQRTDLADLAAQRPEVRRINARTVERTVTEVRLLLDI